jgi:23S rRNA (pseudouridine1915-N3)-methyltransferase
MQIRLVAVGNRMPAWVEDGYRDYAKRLPRECELVLREIAPGQRGKNADLRRTIEDEGNRCLASVAASDHVVALDLSGQEWSTPQLADALKRWMGLGSHVTLLVGGPDGLAPACLERARERWRLSALTFPHPLVRLVVAEQIYRAWTLLQNHPYHR